MLNTYLLLTEVSGSPYSDSCSSLNCPIDHWCVKTSHGQKDMTNCMSPDEFAKMCDDNFETQSNIHIYDPSGNKKTVCQRQIGDYLYIKSMMSNKEWMKRVK